MSQHEHEQDEQPDDYSEDEYAAGIAAMLLEDLLAEHQADTLVIEIPDEEYDFEVRKVTTTEEQRLGLDGSTTDEE